MTSSNEAEMVVPPSRRTVMLVTLGAIVAALLILFAAVLPAEYHRDPTGLGKLTGIASLWAPEEKMVAANTASPAPAARSYPTPFRSDVIDVPLAAAGDMFRGNELEYKVHVEKGGAYIYSWEVAGMPNPKEFYTEFHGHTIEPGKPMTVAYYRKATGTADHGAFTAPFAGVHGWYFQNQSAKSVTVRLRLSGFYTLIPDGQPGNEAGLQARAVAF